MNIHLHHALSDLTGQSGPRITDAILAGQHDPAHLADLADRRVKAPRATFFINKHGDRRSTQVTTAPWR